MAIPSGCLTQIPTSSRLEMIWGRRGIGRGRFQKPRAITIDDKNQVYVVDMTARIQVFDCDGKFLRSWQTPKFKHGKPCGLSVDNQGNLLVADTHYFRMLVYRPDGTLLTERTIGGTCGSGPGQFGFVTDVVQDSNGNYYISEYGEYDRIQKFNADGEFLFQWGGHGWKPGQFVRPQSIAVDQEDRIWVADACNHRLQLFDARGDKANLLHIWGKEGSKLGEFKYPYGIHFDGGQYLYVSEFGNHRVQKLTINGQSIACWGTHGRGPGELHGPWALASDQSGRIHVLDTYNHRVQRIIF